VEYQRRRDPLTGLASHALFLDRLAAATSGPGERIGLCSLDLDGFKAINDTLGYDIGDELLVAVARRLERRVAGLDATVARVGGDEFLLLVADSGGIDAMVALAATDFYLTRFAYGYAFHMQDYLVTWAWCVGVCLLGHSLLGRNAGALRVGAAVFIVALLEHRKDEYFGRRVRRGGAQSAVIE